MYLPLLGHFFPPQSLLVDGYTEVWGYGAAHLYSSQDRGGPMRGAAESQVVPKNITACSSVLQPPHIPLGCSLFPSLQRSEVQQYCLQQEQNGVQVSQSGERPVPIWSLRCNSVPPTLCPQGSTQAPAAVSTGFSVPTVVDTGL